MHVLRLVSAKVSKYFHYLGYTQKSLACEYDEVCACLPGEILERGRILSRSLRAVSVYDVYL